jgi:hypothetical protein
VCTFTLRRLFDRFRSVQRDYSIASKNSGRGYATPRCLSPMKSQCAFFDLPDTRKGTLELREYAFAQGCKRHARSFEEFAAQFVLEHFDGVTQ